MPALLPGTMNRLVEATLDDKLAAIEAHFKADGMAVSGPLYYGIDDLIRDALEHRARHGHSDRLVCLLTTGGGYIEVVQRIVDTMRHHYPLVDFIVPDHAYSAGTVLVMSGDAIWMDYYSRLGPIDPQVENREGRMVPALGYLERYNELLDRAATQEITLPEVQLVISGFDQAELHHYEQARQLSITLLKDWLVRYKFKNWTRTRDRNLPVTDEMRAHRAVEIATELNRTTRWHVHGHGISKRVLEEELNLQIDDFETPPGLRSHVRSYHDLIDDYQRRTGQECSVHTRGWYNAVGGD